MATQQPPTGKPDEKKPLTDLEKSQILREAVSYYLRNDFRDPEIREVCEEFITDADNKLRASAGVKPAEKPAAKDEPTPPHEHHSHEQHYVPPESGTKSKR